MIIFVDVLGVGLILPLLFLARIIDGASAGNFSTAKAAITDITSKEERVTSLGVTFAAESLGLIMGPVLGGLSAYGFSVSAFIAADIALVSVLLTLFFFTETRDFAAQPASEQKSAFAGFHELLNVFRSANTRTFILVVFVLQLLITMMWGALALYGKALFGFTGQEIGYNISAFAALVGISAQTGLLEVLTRVTSEKRIITGAVLTMSAGMLLLAFSQTIAVLLIGVGLMASSFNVGMPTVVGLISKRSSENEQGSLMGSVSFIHHQAVITDRPHQWDRDLWRIHAGYLPGRQPARAGSRGDGAGELSEGKDCGAHTD